MSIDWHDKAQRLVLRVRNFVNGRSEEGRGEVLTKYNPRDGGVLCQFHSSTADEVNSAVASARSASEDGRWSELPMGQRKLVLERFSSLITAHAEELALLDCLDVGKPIRDAYGFDVPTASSIIKYNAEAADKVAANVYAVDRTSLSYELRRPLGVVAAIVGWNFPMLLAATKIGPVLAAGNSLILKPSEMTSLSACRLVELAHEAGVPEGVLNVIHGGPEVGVALSAHHDVDLVTFTGSTRTGKAVLAAAGQSNLKRTILECGGKAPNIVFDDCPNLEAVADSVVARAFWNQGQVCTASSRLLIHQDIKEDLLSLIIERTARLRLGDPLDPKTEFGALVSDAHRRKVIAYAADGVADGAVPVYEGSASPPFANGFYVPVTIFDRVRVHHKIACEEIFGPLLAVMSFRDETEAVRIANDTIYGLSAILWTSNLTRAHRVTQAIKAGWIVVNATAEPMGGPTVGVLSVEGHKQSGLGAEGGVEGLRAYTSRTAVQMFV